MTHIIVKDGRVAVSGGRVVTSAGGAPCCCGGGGPDDDNTCDNGCSIRCDGPDCRVAATSLDISCVSVDFGSINSIQVCPDYNSTREWVVTIYAFPTMIHVPRQLGVYFYTEFPILARTDHRQVSTGRIVNTYVHTSASIWLQVKHCTTPKISTVACPMASDIRVSGTGLNFSSGNEALKFGNPHANRISLGCRTNTGGDIYQTVLGSAVVQESAACGSPQTNYYARICGGEDRITVDITQRPASDTRFNILYRGDIYVLTNEVSDELSFAVTWTSEGCDEPPADLWPIARECSGTRTLTFDPATRPADGVTFIVGTVRYRPTNVMSEEAPSSGTWSPDPCPPTDACADLILNDPRCSLPQYRDCPQCVGFDVGDPQPEPDFDLQDDGTIPGLGDMVAEAIRTISLNTILPCSACERRKQVLNRFGERAGRAVIRLLRW